MLIVALTNCSQLGLFCHGWVIVKAHIVSVIAFEYFFPLPRVGLGMMRLSTKTQIYLTYASIIRLSTSIHGFCSCCIQQC